MSSTTAEIERRLKVLEDELARSVQEAPARFRYQIERGRVRFEAVAIAEHRMLRTRLLDYVRHARLPVALTAPVIYVGFVPFVLLDLYLAIYQLVCFPIYGIPHVRRADYVIFDRGRLAYLNALERLNCRYCSYANGLCEYVTEITARTEQHWCPIKHARRIPAPHSRYARFLTYGDAQEYRRELASVQCVRRSAQCGDARPRNTGRVVGTSSWVT